MDAAISAISPRTRMLVLALGSYAFAGGVVSFFGWAGGVHQLTDWFNLGISIQPNSTLASMAGGAAVGSLAFSYRKAAVALGLVSLLIGFAALFQTLSGINLGTDTLILFGRPWGTTATIAPGRIGTPGSISFMLLGLSAILAGQGPAGRRATVVMALSATVLATLSVLGYLYHADLLYALPRYTAISLQTSTMIIATGLGLVLTQTDREPMRTLMQDTGAGLLVRRALPVVILVPITLAWLRTLGEEAGLFDAGMGRALLVMLLVLIMVGGLWWIARPLARHEAAVKDAGARQTLLAEVGELFARSEDAALLLESVCRAAARHFRVSRAGYTRVDILAGRVVVEHDYREDGMDALAGAYPLADYAGFYRAEAEAGKVVAIADMAEDPRTASGFEELFAPLRVRAFLVVPLIRDGKWVANFWISHQGVRHWTSDDMQLMRTLADRVQAAVENKEHIRQLEQADVKLVQAARMEAVGRLAGGWPMISTISFRRSPASLHSSVVTSSSGARLEQISSRSRKAWKRSPA